MCLVAMFCFCGQIVTHLLLKLCICTMNSEDRTTVLFREAAARSTPVNKILSSSFCILLFQFRKGNSYQTPPRWEAKLRYFHAKFELLPHQGPKKHLDLFSGIFLYFVYAVSQHQGSLLPMHVYWGLVYWKMPAVGCPNCTFTFSGVHHSSKFQFFKLFQQ